MDWRLINAESFHPTLAITLPPALLTSHECMPHVLVHLPPGVFYDPFTADNAMTQAEIGKSRSSKWKVVSLAEEVELEHAVGWSVRRNRADAEGVTKANEGQGRERRDADEDADDLERQIHHALQEALRDTARKHVADSAEPQLGKARVTVPKPKTETKKAQQEAEAEAEASTLLIELLTADGFKATSDNSDGFQIEVPLHLRYHPPSISSSRIYGSTNKDPLPSAASPYLTLLSELLPKSIVNLFALSSSSSSATDRHTVNTAIPAPTLYLTCATPSRYIPGFYSTSLHTLFPATHAHLLASSPTTHSTVLALSHPTTTPANPNAVLPLKIPVPPAELLAPVQLTTLFTVVTAAFALVYHLLSNVIPLVEAAEKSL